MAPSSVELPDLDALDSNGLKSLILRNHALLLETSAELKSKQSELESHQNEIERLKRKRVVDTVLTHAIPKL